MFDVITFGSATRDVFLRSKAMELHKEHGIKEACFPFGAKIDVEDITLETGGGATNNAVTFSRLAKLKTAVLGATGYSGLELARLLGRHPRTEAPLLLRRSAETDDGPAAPLPNPSAYPTRRQC